MRPRTVLLDLDGTLLDSATGITEHLSSAMAAVGAGGTPQAHCAATSGRPSRHSCPTWGWIRRRSWPQPRSTGAPTILWRRPCPGPIRGCLSYGGASPTSTVMVGDRLHDVHGAAAHDLATIGVSWGYAEPDELLSAGAFAVVDTPEELGDLLLRHFGCL